MLLSTSGSRRQLSIDKNERQRGSDPDDAPLLLDGEGGCGEGDVVIGAEEGDQADQQATDHLNQAWAVQPGLALVEMD